MSVVCNFALVAAKAVAFSLSGSLAVVSSLADSALDIFTSTVLWVTAWFIARPRKARGSGPHGVDRFPVGKRRLEALAVLVCACVMASASLQIIVQCVQDIVNNNIDLIVDTTTVALLATTVGVKLLLYLVCSSACAGSDVTSNASVAALRTDHLNDTLSNGVTLGMAYVAAHAWIYADPVGGSVAGVGLR